MYTWRVYGFGVYQNLPAYPVTHAPSADVQRTIEDNKNLQRTPRKTTRTGDEKMKDNRNSWIKRTVALMLTISLVLSSAVDIVPGRYSARAEDIQENQAAATPDAGEPLAWTDDGFGNNAGFSPADLLRPIV